MTKQISVEYITSHIYLYYNVNILLFLSKTSFRGQTPWTIRERLISQAINKTLELKADYICNAKFVKISYQWEAMYATAVACSWCQ